MTEISHRLQQQVPRLRRYTRALLGEQSLADELVQECLLRAKGRSHLWRDDNELRIWLLTIVHNVFSNDLRRFGEPQTAPKFAAGSVAAMQLFDIQHTVLRLPPLEREVILLIGLEQLSYAEAASVLDVSSNTLLTRLGAARERLRQLMSVGETEQAASRRLQRVK